jgi:hypothetical protein
MPEQSSASTNGADTAAVKVVSAKKKPKTKTAKKKAAKKKRSGAKVAKKRAAKKVAAKAAKTPPADAKKKPTGRYPTASLRFLLLREKHPEESAAAVARMVYCSPNQITKVKENKEKYEKMIAEMSDEKRQELLTTFIPKQSRGGKKAKTPAQNGAADPKKAAVANGDERAIFRNALRLVGISRARQLLEEFEKEE